MKIAALLSLPGLVILLNSATLGQNLGPAQRPPDGGTREVLP